MNLFDRIQSFFYTLFRGYLAEARVRGSRRQARQWITDAIAGAKPLDELQIQYWAGSPYWSRGQTFMVLSGDGKGYIRNCTQTTIIEKTGSVSAGDFTNILQTTLNENWFSISPRNHPGRPDDSEVLIAIVDIHADLKFYIKTWEATIGNYPGYKTVFVELRKLMAQLSGGVISG